MPASARTSAKPVKKPTAKLKAPGPTGNFYLGQIEAFAFDFAPAGWLPCDGRRLPINQNQALFSLLGTAYGGDGRTYFCLPKLAPITPPGPQLFIAASATTFPFPSRN
jgi:hypothetical protein